MLLEVACFNFDSALIAQKAGAHRIELCVNYKAGGISPSEELIQQVRSRLSIPVFIMIRPRPGNFVYPDSEFQEMKKQIRFSKQHKCDGVVFGILTPDNKIDIEKCKELVELSKPLPCTFHRAFDEINDSEEGLEQLIALGFARILTSGKARSAPEGSAQLKKLITKAENRIIVIAGGGIRSSNVSRLILETCASEVHSSAIIDSGETANEDEIKKILDSI